MQEKILSEKEIEEYRKKLIEHIDKEFPEDKKESAKQQLSKMDNKQILEVLKQNNLIPTNETQQCIFCSIIQGQIPSHRLDENEQAIAILELNPISSGHTLIIPKQHIKTTQELTPEVYELSEKVKQRIHQELKPKEIISQPSNILGHEFLNIIPIYTDETSESERKKITEEELVSLQKTLKEKPKPIEQHAPQKIISEEVQLPKRIP